MIAPMEKSHTERKRGRNESGRRRDEAAVTGGATEKVTLERALGGEGVTRPDAGGPGSASYRRSGPQREGQRGGQGACSEGLKGQQHVGQGENEGDL